MKIRRITLLLWFITILLTVPACKKTPTESDDPHAVKRIFLIEEDVSCTAAWLKIVKEGLSDSSTIKLFRDTTEILQFHLSGVDTTIYTEGLLPGRQYKFIARNPELTELSEVTVKTLDTTTYNITWQKYTAMNTYGDGNDVLIVNDSTFYFASDTQITDSSYEGQYGFGKIVNHELRFYPVWVSTLGGYREILALQRIIEVQGKTFGCTAAHLLEIKNEKFEEKAFFVYSTPYDKWVRDMWGKDSNNIYLSAANGHVYYYNGRQIKSNYLGTSYDYTCIYGAQKRDGTDEILTVGYESRSLQNSIVSLNTDGSYKADMDTTGLRVPLMGQSIWYQPERLYVIAGWYGAFWRRNMYEGKWERIVFPAGYRQSGFRRMYASGLNDILILHQDGSVYHFNGVRWNNLHVLNQQIFAFINGIDRQGNKIALFGSDLNLKCVAYIGTMH